MEKTYLIITGRIYEVPTIVQFTLDALGLNLADFILYKPNKYTPAFITSIETRRDAINQIVNPVVLTAEMKLITLRMMNNVIGLRYTMNLLEGYVADATGLTVAPADFGIKEVRKSIASGDVEGLNGNLNTVLTNITNNMTALEAMDYTPAMKAELVATKKSIADDNAAQNMKLEERGDLVRNNIVQINDLLADVKGIWADGKRLYSLKNKEKAKFFTNADIIRRIRNDELHTVITGKVYDKDGKLAVDAKIVARPTTEGKRGKTVRSNNDGVYEVKGLRPVNYMLKVTLKNGGIFMANTDAVTNKTVTLDLKEGV